MLIFENIKLALSAIRANKMRSFLTMLGMIIGISSVIAIVSMGQTMRNVIADEYKNVGTNLAYTQIMSQDGMYTENMMFSYEYFQELKDVFGDELEYVSPDAGAAGKIVNGRKIKDTYLTGLAENPTAKKNLKIVYGKMFTDIDIKNERPYIIIEDKTAKEIFGTEDATGKTMRVSVAEQIMDLTVIGIYENDDSAIMKLLSAGGGSARAQTYVPETIISRQDEGFWSICTMHSESISPEKFEAKLKRYIAKTKSLEETDINYYSAQQEMSSMDSMMSTLSLIVGAIAAISLLVGGIGIMNIMLVSVTERTREIGIRKALGARTEDILLQFLVESAIISAAGGIIGTALGIGVVAIGGALVGVAVSVSPSVVIIAVSFSAIVGIFFGLYPASKAAKADPITALRYE